MGVQRSGIYGSLVRILGSLTVPVQVSSYGVVKGLMVKNSALPIIRNIP